MISSVLALVCAALALGIDQLTKLYIMSNFSLGESKNFIDGLLNLVYIHNTGAAWGVFSGRTWLLVGLTAVVMVFCVVLLIKGFGKQKIMTWSLSLVISGGIGNLIDRVFRNGNVVDFLQFDFYQSFPVFNIADCCIVIGAGLLILHYLLETIEEFKQKKLNNGED